MAVGLEIMNLHAQGGMAEVYRARATDAQGRTWFYAVKRILPELLKEPGMLPMFLEEQRIAALLEHDNIVRVYDVAQNEGGTGPADTFIVMEFLEGKDLGEVIALAEQRGQPLPVWFVIHVAREVLKALEHVATQAKDKAGRALGLIHRDISPHNIFVCSDGQVKLTDFGVARVQPADVRTRAGIIKGKFGYMSPEQLEGRPLDFRSDLYNVGILLYEALTSQRLFSGDTPTQFVASMMRNEVPQLPAQLPVPPELDALMREALSRAAADRPSTAAAFEARLGAIAARYGLHATRGHIALELSGLQQSARASTAEGAPEASTFLTPSAALPARRAPPRLLTMINTAAPPSSVDAVFTSRRLVGTLGRLDGMLGGDPPPPERTVAGPVNKRRKGGDELLPTLLEDRPTSSALGSSAGAAAEPDDLLAEPLADPVSEEGPGTEPMRDAAPDHLLGKGNTLASEHPDDSEVHTSEMPMMPFARARPKTRVSTGSRRVITLSNDPQQPTRGTTVPPKRSR